MSAPETVWCGVCRALVPADANGRAGLHAVTRGAVCYGTGAPPFNTYPGAPVCLACDDLALSVPDGATLACPACGKAHAGVAGEARTVGAVTVSRPIGRVSVAGSTVSVLGSAEEQIHTLRSALMHTTRAWEDLYRRARRAVVGEGPEPKDGLRELHEALHAVHAERATGIAAQLAKAHRYVAEQWGHEEECPAEDEPAGACTCGHEKLLAMLAPRGGAGA